MLAKIFPSVASIFSLAVIGAVFGLILSIAKKKLKVDKDPRIEKIQDVLPGANCGACGHPGCNGYAMAIVTKDAEINLCPVGGVDVVAQIAEIMGKDAIAQAPQTARLHCQGGNKVENNFEYLGPHTCSAAQMVLGGYKSCQWGCLGLGDCVASCNFDAIEIGSEGLPLIDNDKCKGCGACIEACPRGLISLVDAKSMMHVRCKNQDKAPAMKKYCSVGCIGCKLCERACKKTFENNPNIEKAITVENFIAKIDQNLCISCGACAEACPQNVIANMRLD